MSDLGVMKVKLTSLLAVESQHNKRATIYKGR
jgi:hypothetical protein